MELLNQFKNIFFIGFWLLIIGGSITLGIYAIVKKHIQLENSRFGIWGFLDDITKSQTYTDYYGWKAVVIGIIFIIVSLVVLITPFQGAIVNYFKPGFVDQQGVKHILVKPGEFCGMKLDGGAIASCPEGYICGPKELLQTEGIGICLYYNNTN